MPILAGITVHITSEDVSNSSEITNHPVEEGASTTDHSKSNPQTISLSGIIQGSDAVKQCEELEKKVNNGDTVTFEGHKAYLNMMLSSFEYKASKSIKNGYSFDASLQKIRKVDPSYVKLEQPTKSQVKGASNAGRKQTENSPSENDKVYHTIRKGQTFYAIAPKYGTTWQKVKELNPNVNPRALQIGQKVRVS